MTLSSSAIPRPRRRSWLLFFALVALAASWLGSSYLGIERVRLRREQYEVISTVGRLVVERIATWREYRLADARRAAEGPWVATAFSKARRAPANRTRKDELLRWLENERRAHFDEAMLVQVDGRLFLSTSGRSSTADSASRQLATASLQRRQPSIGNPGRHANGKVYIDVAMPIRDATGLALSVLVLRADAARELFPMLEAWPTPSKSSETFMVRVDGSNVFYLNRLRHLGHEALAVTIPLTRTDVPAVQAALGRRGVFEGTDYRGVRVLADLRKVPGAPWLVMSKVDLAEIYSDVRRRTVLISIALAALVLLVATAASYGYTRQQVRFLNHLRASEQREVEQLAQFRTTLYSIGDAVLTTDTQGFVREMNPVAERLTGWSEAEARGYAIERIFQIVNEDSRETVENPVRTVLREGAVHALANHTLLVGRNGTARPIADSAAPICNEVGVVTGVVLVCSDHTAQRAARHALRASERRLTAVLDNLPGMAYRAVRDTDWAMIFVSEGATPLTGYTPAQLTGEDGISCASLIHPADRARARTALQAAVDGGRPFELEYRLLHATGAIRWVWERGRVDPASASTQPVLESFITDITMRREAEAELHLLGAALNSISNAVAVAERDGTVTWVNAAFTRHTGYVSAEAIGTGVLDCVDRIAVAPALQEAPSEALASAGEWNGEVTMRRRDDSRFPAALSIAPVRDEDGAVRHFIVTYRDLTDEQTMRAQLLQSQKMESIGQLAGGIAHDFNNLLTVILSGTEMAALGLPDDAPQREELEEVHRAGERAANLTRQLLAFSRRQMVSPTILRLDTLLEGMRTMLQRLLSEDIEFVLAGAVDDTRMRADPGQIEQVVLNLAINARDAMPQGGLLAIATRTVLLDEGDVARYPSVEPGAYVMMTVKDTGSGMDAETRARVFEPFFTTKEPGKGTGLGLSTVYGIVKQSGGSVWVDSVLGAGTTFTVYWPYVAEAPTEHRPKSRLNPTHGQQTVLVVEDDASILSLTSRILSAYGYTVLAAASGAEAVALMDAHEGRIDLLLTDVVMPGMSGLALAALATARRPGLRVLFISGYTDDVILRRGIAEQQCHFLTKPYTIEELTNKIRDVLSERAVPTVAD